MLANYKTVPIYNPRVTLVGGGVMSDVKNLGYPKMNPNIKTTFTLTLKYYTKQAFQNSSSLPAHELLLIYNDQNGKEIKILQPVR